MADHQERENEKEAESNGQIWQSSIIIVLVWHK
jgi:hypothetical protein